MNDWLTAVSPALYGLSVMYASNSMAYDFDSHELDYYYCCDGSINVNELRDLQYLKGQRVNETTIKLK